MTHTQLQCEHCCGEKLTGMHKFNCTVSHIIIIFSVMHTEVRKNHTNYDNKPRLQLVRDRIRICCRSTLEQIAIVCSHFCEKKLRSYLKRSNFDHISMLCRPRLVAFTQPQCHLFQCRNGHYIWFTLRILKGQTENLAPMLGLLSVKLNLQHYLLLRRPV